MTHDDDPIGLAEGASATETLCRAIAGLLAQLDDEQRVYAALAADAGQQPTITHQDDGSWRVDFAGLRLGYVRLSEL